MNTWFECMREFGYPTAVSGFLAWLLLKVGRWLATKADELLGALRLHLTGQSDRLDRHEQKLTEVAAKVEILIQRSNPATK